ncbi:hypothetical protein OUZ56_032283 [Daphnia magna]|uniref:Uncharacterized protein n=1 Tax=Daphnia magna TaxID=35525 RepID=A0ABQ9ZX05_9CRUS|nr:hypothetical protein OUZ56_032283 [Daphnia magna]
MQKYNYLKVDENDLTKKNRKRRRETNTEEPPTKQKIMSQEAKEDFDTHQRLDAEKQTNVPASPNNSTPVEPHSPQAGPSTDTPEKPTARLPERKRGPGRQAKSKALDFFKWSAKPFQKKKNVDQARFVLTKLLAGGGDATNKVLKESSIVTEEMVLTFPNKLSTTILEEDIGDLGI